MPDNVNHPAHYETNGIECIDAMVASQGIDSVMNYCLCNAFKYIWRCQHKDNCREDIQKAIWYLNKYVELDSKRHKSESYIDVYLRRIKQGFQDVTHIHVDRITEYTDDKGVPRFEFTYTIGEKRMVYTYKLEDYTGPDDYYALGELIGSEFLSKSIGSKFCFNKETAN